MKEKGIFDTDVNKKTNTPASNYRPFTMLFCCFWINTASNNDAVKTEIFSHLNHTHLFSPEPQSRLDKKNGKIIKWKEANYIVNWGRNKTLHSSSEYFLQFWTEFDFNYN